MFEAALGTAFALFIVLTRFNLRRICGYKTLVDVVATIAFVWMFNGTYAGVMTGVISGALVSLILNLISSLYGYERASLARAKGKVLPQLIWTRTSGRLT